MGFLEGKTAVCALDERCSEWVRVYLEFCLCGTRDGIALALGLISVLSWGVAEVPQIIANFKDKSIEGLSIAFLATWIVGDIFNLLGCLLEPATLPTQFYMALLYTFTTLILTVQTLYYGHVYHWLKARKNMCLDKDPKLKEDEKLLYVIEEKECKSSDHVTNGSSSAQDSKTTSRPIPVIAPTSSRYCSAGRDLYYMSARSLTKSPVPTWLAHSRDSARTPDHQSSREPLLSKTVPSQSSAPSNTKNMLCVVSSAAFLLCTYGYNFSTKHTVNTSSHGMIILVGRKLLQTTVGTSSVAHGDSSSEIGSFLGWAMAAIYMGGRLPQIYLNIKRGNVEGLSPLMFIFALIGNATYVGSILVNSMEWSNIRPNLPWLVDAGGCVLLDAFILTQFAYFRYRKVMMLKKQLACDSN